MSTKIKSHEDAEFLQQELENGLDENLMQFNKIKFEQMSHGDKRISEMTCRKQSQVKTD